MRRFGLKTLSLLAMAATAGSALTASAHHPDRAQQTVRPRVDVIGPLGNRLRESYRRTYNRPTYIGGKAAYLIAPTSQEAMAWHQAEHANAYKCDKPRLEKHYFYPKPWEVLTTGARKSMLATPDESEETLQVVDIETPDVLAPVEDSKTSADDFVTPVPVHSQVMPVQHFSLQSENPLRDNGTNVLRQ